MECLIYQCIIIYPLLKLSILAIIESNKKLVNADSKTIFTHLMDLNNFKEFLPQDKISEWQSTESSCSFKVAGGYNIGLVYTESTEPNRILLSSADTAPFKFTLDIGLQEKDDKTEAGLICDAELNPFLKMMVEKPLKNLFDYIAHKLEKKYE